MIKIAIIDNDLKSVKRVERVVEEAFSKYNEAVKLCVFENPLNFLTDYDSSYDLVVSEMEYPHTNGIDVVTKLRRVDEQVCVVFFTECTKYAIHGYTVCALDYLLKKYEDKLLVERFSRLYEWILKNKNEHSLVIVQEGVYHKIPIRSVKYVEVNSHVLSYHTANGKLVVRGNLNDVADQLKEHDFVRIHKSYIVNMAEITSIDKKQVTVSTGDELPLSRSNRNEIISTVFDYIKSKKLTKTENA